MHLDVLELRNFYYRTGIGRAAQRAVRDQLVAFWPPTAGQTVVGFGFAVPLLRPYLGTARRVIGLMPGQQGVMAWPVGQPNVSVLTGEAHWPIATGSVDRLVILHGLETSENPTGLLEECQRALAPDGRALFVVPNRSGLWARRDGTPFGFGRPYSLGQIENQLRDYGFMPERHVAALFAPPSSRRFWLRTAHIWEKIGRRLSTRFAGGVLMVEARKEVPARLRPGLGVAFRRPLRVLEGIPAPEPKPI